MKSLEQAPSHVEPGSVVSSDDVIQAYTEMLTDAHRQIALLKAQIAGMQNRKNSRTTRPEVPPPPTDM